MKRIFNFSAGPATLPIDVLKTAQNEFLNYHELGLSIIEMSHRSKNFLKIHQQTKSLLKNILEIPDTHEVLLLQGGASLQFAMIPMNFLGIQPADIFITGTWAKKAEIEIKKQGIANRVASSEDKNFSYIPKDSFQWSSNSAYTHITSNNTIFGTQFHTYPETKSPLVADMSSDILSKRIPISKFHLIYAGAQKNLGPSGVTIVIINKKWAESAPENIPTLLQYRTHINNDSMFNTPPTFSIYILGLVLEWVVKNGGLPEIEIKNNQKSELLYNYIDTSNYYYCPVEKEDRSKMNVVLRIKNNDTKLEEKFIKEAATQGFSGLKGHRSVGGIRASIYNAFPIEGIQKLLQFMSEFKNSNPI